MTRGRITTLVLLALATPALAQQPRDAWTTARTGSASISGVITTDKTPPEPLRRARVMLNGTELEAGRTAITNDDGSFVFDGLRPGPYTLSATKDGYLTMSHGARRPNRPGPGVALRAGENVRVSIQLPRGAVITGTVLDPEGLPAQGVRVLALAYRFMPGPDERRLTPIGTAAPQTTDDRGVFRIFGLPPGDYVVGALPHIPAGGDLQILSESELRRALADLRAGRSSARPGTAPSSPPAGAGAGEKRRLVGTVPVYFPGTPMLERAATVSLATGEERTGVDFQLQYVPTTIVEGMVALPAGATPSASVVLMPEDRSGPSEATRTGRAGPDGRFSIRGVPPGQYTLMARTTVAPATKALPPTILFASTELLVDGENALEVFLSPQPGITISGKVVFEGGSPLAGPLPPVRLTTPLLQAGSNAVFSIPAVQVDADGRFTVAGIPPGSYRMPATLQGIRAPIGRWWLKSFVVGGRDLLDTGLSLKQSTGDAVVTLSTSASLLEGTVRNASGDPAAGTYVIVFPVDKAGWFPNSRRIAANRPSDQGRFSIRNLPPGDYFILAEDDVEPGEWFDPLFLEQLVPRGLRLTLGGDEQKTQDIVIGPR